MRLNRENTLIENNLQPFSGMTPEDVNKKNIVNSLKPYKEIIDQFQEAFSLINKKIIRSNTLYYNYNPFIYWCINL